MSSTNLFHKNVLENMHDGVMTLDMNGTVVMFNPAASRILSIPREQVLGKPFAAVFLMGMEGNDDFNQAVLDAVYESAVDTSSIVEFTRHDGSVVHLSITSSFLKEEEQGDETKGVIVVFSDITTIKELSEAREKLNKKLRVAYVDLETSNKKLQSALKKVQVVRILATVVIIGLFAGLGVSIWMGNPLGKGAGLAPQRVATTENGSGITAQVRSRPITAGISLTGTLGPLEEVAVVTPFQGKVKEKHFYFGQQVKQGDLLVLLDVSEIEVQLREARAAAIKARQSYEQLVKWDQSMEMARARRNFEKQKSLLEETRVLFEIGIVAENEFRNARDQFKTATEELDSVIEKGSTENLRVAEMELENANAKVRQLEAKKKQNRIMAPVNGIVIKPSSEGEKGKEIQVGMPLTEGQILFAVGNLSGMSVTTRVDEVDIGKVHIGQNVQVTGEAFPDVTLKGRIVHVSSQASMEGGGNIPYFDLEIRIDDLTDRQRERVRVGMSANLEVNVYNNPDALVLPIEAVETVAGKRMVTVLAEDGTTRQVEVRTGLTTLDQVEILEGLSKGDTVVYQPGPVEHSRSATMEPMPL